jgi:hypothetical protein
MKSKFLLVAFTVFFSLFLFLGIRASQLVFSDEDQPSMRSPALEIGGPITSEEEPAVLPLQNPFTLIVFVDDLSIPAPVLEGAWLSRSGEILEVKMFFPVFPSQAEDGAKRDLILREAFWMDEPARPSDQFLATLSERNLSWDYILLIDHAAVLEIGVILAEISPDSFQMDSTKLTGLVYSVDNRLISQENQALFIREICQQLPLPGQSELMQRFLEGFSGHLQLSGTTLLDYYHPWQGAIQCEFPTLNLPVY